LIAVTKADGGVAATTVDRRGRLFSATAGERPARTRQSGTMRAERWKPSVTVAAIIEKDGRYLMIEERTRDGLRINNPAGGLEPGESIVEGAIREALEETACRFTPEALLGVYLARNPDSAAGPGVTYLRFALCGTASEPEAGRPLDDPIVRTLWMTADEITAAGDRLRGPLVLQCIADHRAGKRLPLDALYTHPSVARPDPATATSDPPPKPGQD
jgi:8-oxo-dGTP pyrophosphatase MutT (NUDIX family)